MALRELGQYWTTWNAVLAASVCLGGPSVRPYLHAAARASSATVGVLGLVITWKARKKPRWKDWTVSSRELWIYELVLHQAPWVLTWAYLPGPALWSGDFWPAISILPLACVYRVAVTLPYNALIPSIPNSVLGFTILSAAAVGTDVVGSARWWTRLRLKSTSK